jgi:hypothetical protein
MDGLAADLDNMRIGDLEWRQAVAREDVARSGQQPAVIGELDLRLL